ncbi:amino acid ABC transporter [Komagataeibacter swingsii]|uniref:Amino acid ABC transporter n=2 Tax=Komagataeibacter swingsii TaxID=215220 RepID=A0A2V4S6D2_9PROT|nr:amino acid ABC transporter [Komagataeibacter swingsii]GBQ54387.1 amino acid ABC transporter [Komagataeibacter swingsii DSM 16373]
MNPAPLARSLRSRHVAMISIGGIIGAGFFIGASTPISIAGPASLLSYAIAGLLTFLINCMLRDVALHAPDRGSFVNHIRHTLGAPIGFMTGWIYWLVWVTTLGMESMALASLLAPIMHIPYGLIEFLILAIMTAANLMAVHVYGEFEYWFSMLKIIAILVFIMIGVSLLVQGHVPVWRNVASQGLAPHGAMAILAAVPSIIFSMAGTEVVTIAAGESDDPARNVANTARTVAFRIIVFYLASVALILCLVPWTSLVAGQSPFLYTLNAIHVPFAGVAMEIVIVCAMLSTVNSGLYATSRVMFELAAVRDAPSSFMRLHPVTQAPWVTVLFSASAALLIAITAVFSPDVVFAFLLNATGAFVIFEYFFIVLCRIRVCGFTLLPLLTIVLLLCALVAMAQVEHTRHELETGAGMMGVVVIIAMARRAYGNFSRPGRKHAEEHGYPRKF